MAKKSKLDQPLPEDLDGALQMLEEVVQKLEEPELPLEESIELFERGTKLSDLCYSRLREAEKKIEILMKKVPNPDSRDDFETEEFENV